MIDSYFPLSCFVFVQDNPEENGPAGMCVVLVLYVKCKIFWAAEISILI